VQAPKTPASFNWSAHSLALLFLASARSRPTPFLHEYSLNANLACACQARMTSLSALLPRAFQLPELDPLIFWDNAAAM